MILPHNGLLVFSRISELFESLHSEFGTYRCQLDNQEAREKMQSMTLDDKTAKTNEVVQVLSQTRNAFFDGGNEILDQHQCKISKVFGMNLLIESRLFINVLQALTLIDEAKKDIEEKLRLIHKLGTDIKYRQGLWEALKDKAVPKFMGEMGSSSTSGAIIQALADLILWATDLLVTGVAFHLTFKQDQLKEGS